MEVIEIYYGRASSIIKEQFGLKWFEIKVIQYSPTVGIVGN